MTLTYAGICCHAPGITVRPDAADPRKLSELRAAFDRQRKAIERSNVDAIVMVSSEHFANFFLDNMPTFSIGLAEQYEGPIENPDWLNVPRSKVPAHPELAQKIINEVLQTVDVSFAHEWKFDHGMSVPLHFLTPNNDVPIIPVNINCQAPPMAPLHRVWELGKALRRAIDSVPERIALVSTGGTSHWPCTPDTGKINVEWDLRFVDEVINTRKAELLAYDDATAYQDAGQGAFEMRTSVCIAAACEGEQGEVWFFEPMPIFATSCIVATLYESGDIDVAARDC